MAVTGHPVHGAISIINRDVPLPGHLLKLYEQFFFFFDGQVGSASFCGTSAQTVNAPVDKGRPEDADLVGMIACDGTDLPSSHAFGDPQQNTLSPTIFPGILDLIEKLHEFFY
ncbi:hypothetical protein [uncultured Fretibacterium sp.]|uniref:hypothetical protein n=1 Tax=uncultured Fretibacterium sp. TaxID=1678694 RepID=UPI0026337AF7|nr:hypothetical protein [uncultured Fretibacterium sp.]